MDIWTKQKRSEVMSRIRGKNTKPEMILRSELFKRGFRFRVHRKDLPGKPDIVLQKYKTIIFVHGCFWHGHTCSKGVCTPKKNKEYWTNKVKKTMERDYKNLADLNTFGWETLIVWECELKEQDLLVRKLKCFLSDSKG